MFLSPNLALICPLDDMQLTRKAHQLICENGHSFDIARQGYVNLLPVQQKKSKQPGDSKEMVAARHRFLESGYYARISAQLNEIVASLIADAKQIEILDAGCGEGYYLTNCLQNLQAIDSTRNISCLGMDISKPAIIAAAKRHPAITWVVGTNKYPPVAAHSIDVIICMFGFFDMEVFSRILKPGGHVILADSGVEHLLELRQIIYPYIKPPVARQGFPNFELLNSTSLKYSVQLNQESLADLLVMTPHLYRASRQGKDAVKALTELDVTVDVLFRIFRYQTTESANL